MSATKPALEAAELLRAVVSNAPIVLFAFEADGLVTLCEGRALKILGRKPGESVGRNMFELYADYPQFLACCRRALAGETLTAVVSIDSLSFETRFTPQLDWGGKVTGVIGVATDVTEARAATLAKDEFLSVISHELRTPLASATGWAWMMREGELNSAEGEKAVTTILRNLEDIKRLIGELRDASHAATGTLRLTLKKTDLAAAVRQAAKSLAAAAQAKEQKLELSARTLSAYADKTRVRQIAWILLSNAVKYSPKSAALRVRLERVADEAVLTVADPGPGVPPSLRGQIFDMARLPAVDLPPRGRGLGLGLSIARRLAELHGGTIALTDAEEGGSVFTFRMPLSARKARKA